MQANTNPDTEIRTRVILELLPPALGLNDPLYQLTHKLINRCT